MLHDVHDDYIDAAMMKDLSLIEEDLKQLICAMLF